METKNRLFARTLNYEEYHLNALKIVENAAAMDLFHPIFDELTQITIAMNSYKHSPPTFSEQSFRSESALLNGYLKIKLCDVTQHAREGPDFKELFMIIKRWHEIVGKAFALPNVSEEFSRLRKVILSLLYYRIGDLHMSIFKHSQTGSVRTRGYLPLNKVKNFGFVQGHHLIVAIFAYIFALENILEREAGKIGVDLETLPAMEMLVVTELYLILYLTISQVLLLEEKIETYAMTVHLPLYLLYPNKRKAEDMYSKWNIYINQMMESRQFTSEEELHSVIIRDAARRISSYMVSSKPPNEKFYRFKYVVPTINMNKIYPHLIFLLFKRPHILRRIIWVLRMLPTNACNYFQKCILASFGEFMPNFQKLPFPNYPKRDLIYRRPNVGDINNFLSFLRRQLVLVDPRYVTNDYGILGRVYEHFTSRFRGIAFPFVLHRPPRFSDRYVWEAMLNQCCGKPVTEMSSYMIQELLNFLDRETRDYETSPNARVSFTKHVEVFEFEMSSRDNEEKNTKIRDVYDVPLVADPLSTHFAVNKRELIENKRMVSLFLSPTELPPKVELKRRQKSNTSLGRLNPLSRETLVKFLIDASNDASAEEANVSKDDATTDDYETATDKSKTTTDGPKKATDELKTSTDEPRMMIDDPKKSTDGSNITTDELMTATNEHKTAMDEPEKTTDELNKSTDELKTTTDESKMATDELKASMGEFKTTTDEPKTTSDESKTSKDESKTTTDEPNLWGDEIKKAINEFKAAMDEVKTATDGPKTPKDAKQDVSKHLEKEEQANFDAFSARVIYVKSHTKSEPKRKLYDSQIELTTERMAFTITNDLEMKTYQYIEGKTTHKIINNNTIYICNIQSKKPSPNAFAEKVKKKAKNEIYEMLQKQLQDYKSLCSDDSSAEECDSKDDNKTDTPESSPEEDNIEIDDDHLSLYITFNDRSEMLKMFPSITDYIRN